MDKKDDLEMKLNNDISVPEECKKSTEEIEKISDESVLTHYAFINVLVLVAILLVTAISFIVLTDEEKMDSVENPLTLETFSSGKFASNIQQSYVKNLPFAYEFKSAGNKTEFIFGLGNELKKYKKHEEIVRVSDEDIEQEKQEAQKNIEKALKDEEKSQTTKATTTQKVTTEEKTETGAQRISTTKRSTTAFSKATTQETTSLTTTNNDPPEVVIITTAPPY